MHVCIWARDQASVGSGLNIGYAVEVAEADDVLERRNLGRNNII
jgi:hypothetical protein